VLEVVGSSVGVCPSEGATKRFSLEPKMPNMERHFKVGKGVERHFKVGKGVDGVGISCVSAGLCSPGDV